MQLAHLIIHNFLSFVFIISFIVFIHEFGHFIVARWCGVKVEEFSIGFGRELFGFYDKHQTRWKFCLLPFGGYVKMFGDRNGASMPDNQAFTAMSAAEKSQSFLGKNVWQRMAIVAAGPVANFILTILLFTVLLQINGLNKVLPVVGEVVQGGAAFEAGLQKGDKILAINDKKIADFDDMRLVVMESADKKLQFKIQRGEEFFISEITPKTQVRKDFFGDEVKVGTLGVVASEVVSEKLNLGQSFVQANIQTYKMAVTILKALGELITGQRSIDELGGPIKIAQYSGKTVDMGLTAVVWFIAIISVNLGVMNLLPVPVLDGGHLFFYIIEAVRGKPLSQQTQQLGYRIGMTIVLTLMIFTTFNDVRKIGQKMVVEGEQTAEKVVTAPAENSSSNK